MSRKRTPARLAAGLSFDRLVGSIRHVHAEAAVQASRAVNLSLTVRNWLIGCHIAEYELRGDDRATYGEGLLDSLAAELTRLGVSNSNRRQLYRYLRFYRAYPGMGAALSPPFRAFLPDAASTAGAKVGTPSPQSALPVKTLLDRLSYSHLELVVDQDDARKRDFYRPERFRSRHERVKGRARLLPSFPVPPLVMQRCSAGASHSRKTETALFVRPTALDACRPGAENQPRRRVIRPKQEISLGRRPVRNAVRCRARGAGGWGLVDGGSGAG